MIELTCKTLHVQFCHIAEIHINIIPAASNEEQYTRQFRSGYNTGCMECLDEYPTPDLESYVEELCSSHDSSIFLRDGVWSVLHLSSSYINTCIDQSQ